ncbi:MAG TPA: type II toxin-antitoxin system VapB family antitoxin [Desulfobacteraceae bacterium]|nr:type II toxin-antitoxin system VapB family antitoxin [Desulfobacteraceae bacterium]
MGRTNVVIDDDLVNECQKLTGIRTRRALIDYALHQVRRRGRQKRLLELKGTIKWDGDLTEWREARAGYQRPAIAGSMHATGATQ